MTDSSKEPSKGAWTPGKWFIFKNCPIFDGCDVIFSEHIEDAIICSMGHDVREVEANALLISKAPQMAEMWLDLIEAAGDQKLPLWLVGRLHAAKCLLTDLYPNEEKGRG